MNNYDFFNDLYGLFAENNPKKVSFKVDGKDMAPKSTFNLKVNDNDSTVSHGIYIDGIGDAKEKFTDIDADIKELFDKVEELETKEKYKFYNEEMLDHLLKDKINEEAERAEAELKKVIENEKRNVIDNFINSIRNVHFSGDRTVVIFKNGEKVIVKCQEGDKFDKEKGLAMVLLKALFGNTSYFNTIFKKFVDED